MRRNRTIFALLAMVLGALATAPTGAAVRFHLRGHVPAACAIERQSAAPTNGGALVELEVLCNLQAFTLSAPDADGLTLDSYHLSSRDADSPAVAERAGAVDFSGLAPGRHLIRLRVASSTASMRLAIEAR